MTADVYWVLWPFLVGAMGLAAVYWDRLLPSRLRLQPPEQFADNDPPATGASRRATTSSVHPVPRQAAE